MDEDKLYSVLIKRIKSLIEENIIEHSFGLEIVQDCLDSIAEGKSGEESIKYANLKLDFITEDKWQFKNMLKKV